jgi:hypothetical protein
MSIENQVVAWNNYVEALYCRFGGQKDLLEELKDLKHEGDLETYIQDFKMLWNRAEIIKKQALVFFLGELEVEIKNLVKMFQPKALYQAYNLVRLQINILSHIRSLQSPAKHSTLTNNFIAQTRINSFPTFHKNTFYFTNPTLNIHYNHPGTLLT